MIVDGKAETIPAFITSLKTIIKQPAVMLVWAGLIAGLFLGFIGGLNRGGSAVVKHYSLRFILWKKGYTPHKFIKFLDHCARLIFLKKVGGGYMFIHRMLLEHFAERDIRSSNPKESI